MKRSLLTIVFIYVISVLSAQENIKVYPTHWWVGMKNPNLQLMIHGKDIATQVPQFKLPANGIELAPGVRLKKVQKVENPNYVFLDLVIDKNAKPGTKSLKSVFPNSNITVNYELKSRRPG